MRYLKAAAALAEAIDPGKIDDLAHGLASIRAGGGRLFVLGVGGGAGHASHAVNDFRSRALWRAMRRPTTSPRPTARTNDDGWETSFSGWLEISRLGERDALFGSRSVAGWRVHNVSTNLVRAMEAARDAGAAIYGIVGAPGGTLAELANVAILLEPPPTLRTPLVESFQAVVWHALVSHPELAVKAGHWESLGAGAIRERISG